ncbi:MAG TPA: hypothetical protein VFV27_10060 [Nevskiaceae bacterium]|nr:hypothetical protein [Nevskiaceae bacterium]
MSRETDAKKLLKQLPGFELCVPSKQAALVHMPYGEVLAGVYVDRTSAGKKRSLKPFAMPFCFGSERFVLSDHDVDSRVYFDLSQPSEQARALQAIRELALPWILQRKTLPGLLECTPEPRLTRLIARVEKAPRFAFIGMDVSVLIDRIHLLAAVDRLEDAMETIHKIMQQYEHEKMIATPEPQVGEQQFSETMRIRSILLAGPEAVRQWLAENSQRTRRALGFV